MNRESFNFSFLFSNGDFRNRFLKALKQDTAVPVAVPVKTTGGDQSKEKEEYPTHLSVRANLTSHFNYTHINTHTHTHAHTQINTHTYIYTHTYISDNENASLS